MATSVYRGEETSKQLHLNMTVLPSERNKDKLDQYSKEQQEKVAPDNVIIISNWNENTMNVWLAKINALYIFVCFA